MVRERAVRTVFDHEGEHGSPWAAIRSLAVKIGFSGEAIRDRLRQSECGKGQRAGPTTHALERIDALKWENRAFP